MFLFWDRTQGVYPQRPHPKDAVKRMQKATMPIIHRSSDFMVLSPLLIVIV